MGESRWCLRPSYGRLELLLVPKKDWAYTLGLEVGRQLREQVERQAVFLVDKANRASQVLEAMSNDFPAITSSVSRFTAKGGLQRRRVPMRLSPVEPLRAKPAQAALPAVAQTPAQTYLVPIPVAPTLPGAGLAQTLPVPGAQHQCADLNAASIYR